MHRFQVVLSSRRASEFKVAPRRPLAHIARSGGWGQVLNPHKTHDLTHQGQTVRFVRVQDLTPHFKPLARLATQLRILSQTMAL